MKKQQTTAEAEPGVTGLKEVNPVMGSPSIMHAGQGVKDSLTFTEHLKEIDRELGISKELFRANMQQPAKDNLLNLNSNSMPPG